MPALSLSLIWREFRRAVREMDGLRVMVWELLDAQGVKLPYPKRPPAEPPAPPAPNAPPVADEARESRFYNLEL